MYQQRELNGGTGTQHRNSEHGAHDPNANAAKHGICVAHSASSSMWITSYICIIG
jgi:hypothetical protein